MAAYRRCYESMIDGNDTIAAVKSTRVGRAIVNSTLLTQHTLTAMKNYSIPNTIDSLMGSDTTIEAYRRYQQREKRKNRRKANSEARRFNQQILENKRNGAGGSVHSRNASVPNPYSISIGGDNPMTNQDTTTAIEEDYAFEWVEDGEDLSLFALPEFDYHHRETTKTTKATTAAMAVSTPPISTATATTTASNASYWNHDRMATVLASVASPMLLAQVQNSYQGIIGDEDVVDINDLLVTSYSTDHDEEEEEEEDESHDITIAVSKIQSSSTSPPPS